MPVIVALSSTTSAQDIINRALRLLAQLESGESATANETADALAALNALIDSWRNEALMCYALQEVTYNITGSGVQAFSIGPSGTVVSTRPISIVDAYVTYLGVDTNVAIVEMPQWDAIPLKTVTSTIPDRLYYRPDMPDGTVQIYPVPMSPSLLHMVVSVPLESFASASSTLQLPPGWVDALVYNLAVAIAPEYEMDARHSVIAQARNAKAGVKRANTRPIVAAPEIAQLVGSRRPFNIYTGQ